MVSLVNSKALSIAGVPHAGIVILGHGEDQIALSAESGLVLVFRLRMLVSGSYLTCVRARSCEVSVSYNGCMRVKILTCPCNNMGLMLAVSGDADRDLTMECGQRKLSSSPDDCHRQALTSEILLRVAASTPRHDPHWLQPPCGSIALRSYGALMMRSRTHQGTVHTPGVLYVRARCARTGVAMVVGTAPCTSFCRVPG